MPVALGDRVRVIADGRQGRVSMLSPGSRVVVLVSYQAGVVEVAEEFTQAAVALLEV